MLLPVGSEDVLKRKAVLDVKLRAHHGRWSSVRGATGCGVRKAMRMDGSPFGGPDVRFSSDESVRRVTWASDASKESAKE